MKNGAAALQGATQVDPGVTRARCAERCLGQSAVQAVAFSNTRAAPDSVHRRWLKFRVPATRLTFQHFDPSYSAMLSTKPRPITRHEYALIPVGAPNYQLIEGDLVMAPSPSTPHQTILSKLDRLIGNFLDAHPLGRHFIAPLDVHLSDLNVYQPDLLFVANDNLRIIEEHGIEGAPNLVVEILSKTSGKYDLGPKRSVYARTGVEELWIVDPAKRTLALYRLTEDADTPAATYRAKQKFTSTLLPGLSLDLAVIFAP
jgi:Uma2 family endonuclease